MQAAMSSKTETNRAGAAAAALPFGSLTYFGAAMSLLACYGQAFILSTLAGLGLPDVVFNPHLQAVLMWLLGVIAIYGLFLDRRYHGKSRPLVLGSVGVAIIVATLYTHYSPTIEVTGYLLLVAAALLNQNARLAQLNREVEGQSQQLELQACKLAEHNRGLVSTVDSQVVEIEKLARLKQFLAPEVARIVLDQQQGTALESHRRYIVTLFCDIRGFTAFSERSEPEEVMAVLQEYHTQMGRLVAEHGGTIDHRAGDGLMVFFNDPIPCRDPEMRAIALAQAMREQFRRSNRAWTKQGYDLGFGIGIASGYATLGIVGYQDRYDYTANGYAVNLASRLCDLAGDGEILISHKTYLQVEDRLTAEALDTVNLKGIGSPVPVYSIPEQREPSVEAANLSVLKPLNPTTARGTELACVG